MKVSCRLGTSWSRRLRGGLSHFRCCRCCGCIFVMYLWRDDEEEEEEEEERDRT